MHIGADLYSPDLGEFVQGQFAPQELDDSFNSLTVLSLVNVTCVNVRGTLFEMF